ncbi:MAG TPA: transglutaminase-like domain-containing protein [Candidatus Kryptonia bacterium]|nr:transglutaminase-like domain-containing protein [Candidatus Kryptonia bacterium]
MGRVVRIAIIVVWLALVGVLVRERWTTPLAAPVDSAPAALRPGEQWMNVYRQDQKIGYVHQRSTATDDGFEFEERSLLRLVVMDTPQTVRTIITGRTANDYALRQFSFELSSGVGALRVHGAVHGSGLDLTLATGAEESTQRIALTGPIYLPATLRNLVARGELRAGRQFDVQVFDPSTMKDAATHIVVEQHEQVPDSQPPQSAWRVREEYKGIHTTAWLDEQGTVLREEGPMGLVLRRTDQDDALHNGWHGGAALDLVQTVAIPVVNRINNPRDLSVLRLRLRGIDLDQIPSDPRQHRTGDTWTITREDLQTVTSYPLPYSDDAQRPALAATPLLQVDHPRVRAAAAEAVGDEHDAVHATRRLLAWIHGYMKQVITMSIPNALQVLDERQGDCNEHAVLFAALARAAGIPTRVAAGVVYLDGAFYYHAWDEVWLGRWVSVDPVFNQFPADATHVKFIEGGPEEHVALLQVMGRVGIDVLASR